MADSFSTPFIMHGARAAIDGGMHHIKEQVTGIELAVAENPGLTFDLARTLVESICRTVLTERDIPFDHKDDLPRLFKTVTSSMPFLPTSASGDVEARQSLVQTLNGLHTSLQGICELRNRCGFASHGASEQRPAMESIQALLAAEAADTIVGFLHRVHRQEQLPHRSLHSEYNEYQAFNDEVDESHGLIRIFEAEFRPSEVLFQMEPETYRVYLAEFSAEVSKEESEVEGEGTTEVRS